MVISHASLTSCEFLSSPSELAIDMIMQENYRFNIKSDICLAAEKTTSKTKPSKFKCTEFTENKYVSFKFSV